MDKIFRRKTQNANEPKKLKNPKDEKNRKRNVIMNFRVTEREKELIERRIKISGLARGRFFIESCMYQAVLVKGNVKTFSEIKNSILKLSEAIEKDPKLENLEEEHAQSLRMILEILNNISKKEAEKNGK